MFIQTGSLNRMFQSRLILRNAMSWLALCMGFPQRVLPPARNGYDGKHYQQYVPVSIPESGSVTLPTVGKTWFYTAEGTDRLQPADPAGGTRFMIQVVDCSGMNRSGQALHFTFKPQSAQIDGISKQIFSNETSALAGGAENVGIVIFLNPIIKTSSTARGSLMWRSK